MQNRQGTAPAGVRNARHNATYAQHTRRYDSPLPAPVSSCNRSTKYSTVCQHAVAHQLFGNSSGIRELALVRHIEIKTSLFAMRNDDELEQVFKSVSTRCIALQETHANKLC